MLPHFLACEEAVSVRLNPGTAPAAAAKMSLGAERLGWKSIEVPRWFKYEASPDRHGRFRGTRQSMTEAVIPRTVAAGCRVMAGVRAQRLEWSGAHWTIEGSRDGQPVRIVADTVFVAAGATQTPALLRRSGIKRNVGSTLAMHPTVKAVAVFDEQVNGEDTDVPAQQVKEFAPEMSFGCSIASPPYLALAMLDHPEASREVLRNWRQTAVYYAMIEGPNRGSIRNVPGSPAPLIRYPLEDVHLRRLATALRRLCRLLLEAGARRVFPSIRDFPEIRCPDDLSRIPAMLPRRLTNLMSIHLFSSCPMGENLDVCAADSFGRVHGQRNLILSDASLLCAAPGVNPQGSVMAVARRNALHFLNCR
jgi:choline dehydrogenase-like flavoprotein